MDQIRVLHYGIGAMGAGMVKLVQGRDLGEVAGFAEELAHPWYGQPELASRLYDVACRNGVSLLGTGINPGFVLDTLIICLTGACERVDKIRGNACQRLGAIWPHRLAHPGCRHNSG